MKYLILVCALSGCASYESYAGTQQYARCKYEAKAGSPATANGVVADLAREDELFGLCMQAAGFRPN